MKLSGVNSFFILLGIGVFILFLTPFYSLNFVGLIPDDDYEELGYLEEEFQDTCAQQALRIAYAGKKEIPIQYEGYNRRKMSIINTQSKAILEDLSLPRWLIRRDCNPED